MDFDLNKYEDILNKVSNELTFMDPIDLTKTPEEVNYIKKSNYCLEWLYKTHLKGKYTPIEIHSILCIVKTLLIPHLHSLQDSDSLSFSDISSICKKVIGKFK